MLYPLELFAQIHISRQHKNIFQIKQHKKWEGEREGRRKKGRNNGERKPFLQQNHLVILKNIPILLG